MTADEILALLGQLTVAGGGGAVIAYQIFKSLSSSWLESKFSEKLESFRHEKAKELEHLRAEVDGTLKASLRFQEKEFSVLSECWDLMNKAYGATVDFVSPYQSAQDLKKMSDDLREEYLNTLDLLDAQRKEILTAHDPTNALFNALFLIKNNKASRALSDYRNSVYLGEIFMSEQDSSNFKDVAQAISGAIIAHEIGGMESDRALKRDAWKSLEDCRPKLDDICRNLRARLKQLHKQALV